MLMFMPLIESILSYSISGKMICSRTPMVKLPRPSNPRDDTPRKSRTRGSGRVARRARESHMRSRGRAADVGDGRQGDVDETVEELPHALAAQGDEHADLLALADLERRDVLLG